MGLVVFSELFGQDVSSKTLILSLKLKRLTETEDEKKKVSLTERIFDRIEKICILLWGQYLSEEDAARLLRLSDPKGSGKQTIRNYALRSKKLSFAKIGRTNLLFSRKDLEKLFQGLRSESFRDL